eukprot:1158903-Pelagomonas_calceolata.AAC.25
MSVLAVHTYVWKGNISQLAVDMSGKSTLTLPRQQAPPATFNGAATARAKARTSRAITCRHGSSSSGAAASRESARKNMMATAVQR